MKGIGLVLTPLLAGGEDLGDVGEGVENPILLRHCEGAPGPVPGEIIAAQKSQAILGSSGTRLP